VKSQEFRNHKTLQVFIAVFKVEVIQCSLWVEVLTDLPKDLQCVAVFREIARTPRGFEGDDRFKSVETLNRAKFSTLPGFPDVVKDLPELR
jgi:hypothetical protein